MKIKPYLHQLHENVNSPSEKIGLMTAAALAASTCATLASTDYGPASWVPNCGQYATTGFGHQFHIIHDMEGYYASTISYFQNCGTSTSIHYLVNGKKDASSDYEAGDVTQMVRDANYAFQAFCWNHHATGTEHEGFASNPAWYTESQYQASASITRHLSSAFGWAKDRNHIVGHGEWQNSSWVNYSIANFGFDPRCNTHTDPGPYWDWSHYMSLVNLAPPPPQGLLGARSIPYKGDYTGDGHPDYVVWRPSTGNWHVKNSATLATYFVTFGAVNDIPCPGDYKGDSKVDYVVRRPSNQTWYIKENVGGLVSTLTWGNTEDISVPGNYAGDAKTDYALFRPSTGTWYVKENATLAITSVQFGAVGDIPVAADYNGDGKTDYAVFRPSTGTWYIKDNVTGAVTSIGWGMQDDVPAPGDYDGDGRADYVVWRPSNGTWYVKFSSTLVQFGVDWGQLSDIPVVGVNFQGGANSDYVVWRPSNGQFYVKKYSDGSTYGISWGQNGDYPFP